MSSPDKQAPFAHEPPDDFRQVENCGGTFTFWRDTDNTIASSYQSIGAGPAALLQYGVALDGSEVEFWPIRGIDQRPPREPSQRVPVLIVSDKQGMFGRLCPKCESGYFRVRHPSRFHFCPYCGVKGYNAAFLTKHQRALIERLRLAIIEIAEGAESVSINISSLSAALPENRPEWAYTEETQQTRIKCPDCEEIFDVLGEYVLCPGCGKPTWESMFAKKMDAIQGQFDRADSSLQDRMQRVEEWAKLIIRCVSAFEGLARKIQYHLLALPSHPKRRKDLGDYRSKAFLMRLIPFRDGLVSIY